MVRTKVKELRKLYMIMLLPILLSAFLLYGKETEAAKKGEKKESLDIFISEWKQDVSLKGLFDSTTMYFQTGIWEVKEAKLQLQLNSSRLINKQVSYFTVYLDNNPVKTISFSNKKKETAFYDIVLPSESFTMEGNHSIKVETYLRGQATEACMDDSSISTWVNILSDSKVVLKYKPTLKVNNIASFYKKFVSIEALEKESSIIAVRNNAEDVILTSMAHILSGFAQNATGNYESIKTSFLKEEKDLLTFPYVMYIEKYATLPTYLKSAMTEKEKEYAMNSAVICLIDYKKTKVLLITGNNDIALKKAGDILSNPMIIPTLIKKQVKVNLEEDYKTDSYKWEEYMKLTQYGTEIKGNFEQTASFLIDCPANKKLANSAQLSLDYRYSSNLDFDKSLLTVYVNGTPIGSRELSKKSADGTTELLTIPKDVNTLGSFMVEVKFMLYPKSGWCELTPEHIPWAYVADTSMLKWTTKENTDVFFEYYPFPFIRDGEFSKVKVLLPSNWNEDDMKTMSSILLTLGKWLKSNNGTLEIVSNPKEEDLKDVNIISIGDVSKNPMGVIKEKLIGDTGCAQLAISPYGNSLHGVLTITGKKSENMTNTLEFLGSSERLWEVKGDLFYTDGNNINCRYIRKMEKEITQPKVDTPLVNNENIPFIFLISVIILILLAAAMLLIKYGRRTKSERK